MGCHAHQRQPLQNAVPAHRPEAGKLRALLAVAHTLLTVIYHLLRDPRLEYRELGAEYFEQRDAQQTAVNLVRRLGRLGYEVKLKPRAA